jgi:hypothetical protein
VSDASRRSASKGRKPLDPSVIQEQVALKGRQELDNRLQAMTASSVNNVNEESEPPRHRDTKKKQIPVRGRQAILFTWCLGAFVVKEQAARQADRGERM